jgi:uncharacterized membrane protein YphA (DoxX/SURF4 family)
VNVLLWAAQVALALAFLGAGFDQAANYQDASRRMAWIRAMPIWVARVVGILEIAGAVALIMPGLIRSAVWMTPVAALGLAVLMLFAVNYHMTRRELWLIAFSGAFLLAAVFVAVGRAFIAPL